MSPASTPSFVESLRVAAPYIHEHRGSTFVVVVGGEAARGDALLGLAADLALLQAFGVRVVLVHGDRPQIERRLRDRHAKSRFVGDLRVTDAVALEAAHEAVGATRARFERALSAGIANTPMAGARVRVVSGNFVTAKPIGVRDGVDYQFTGEVRRIDVEAVKGLLEMRALVLISPLGVSPTGESFNLHSHDVAQRVAIAIGADKLIALVEGRGVVDPRRRLIQQLTPAEADALVSQKHLQGTDVRLHLKAAAAAVRGGVRRAHLVDRRRDGALIEELFTRDGSGTLVSAEAYEDMRPAKLSDVGPLAALLRPLEDEGILIRRGRARLEVELDRFVVLERDGMIIGCTALEPMIEDKIGELYCVAMLESYRETGRGAALLEFMEERARKLGLERVFLLTTRSAHFFQERGYKPSSVRQLPAARRASYDRRRRSRVLMKEL
ncbi:MAG: amino-acid N-acetyltransferase [Sandaracinaceae bacterium]